MITIALVDDQKVLLHGLKQFIHQRNTEFSVTIMVYDGLDFISQLSCSPLPDIAFIDVFMDEMDGISTTQFVSKNYPYVKIIGISASYDDDIIKKMSLAGAVGFVTKNADPIIFWEALETVSKNGRYFYTEQTLYPKKVIPYNRFGDNNNFQLLSAKEKEFLSYCVSQLHIRK